MIPIPMILNLLGMMGGGMAGRALLSRLLPSLLTKGGLGATAATFGADALGGLTGGLIGTAAGDAITGSTKMNPEVDEGNGPAFSQLQNKLNQPQDPLSANYMEMLQEMGVDPRRML